MGLSAPLIGRDSSLPVSLSLSLACVVPSTVRLIGEAGSKDAPV